MDWNDYSGYCFPASLGQELGTELGFSRYITWVEDLVPLDLALYNLVPPGLALWKRHDVDQMLDRILSTSE